MFFGIKNKNEEKFEKMETQKNSKIEFYWNQLRRKNVQCLKCELY
tara:strand:+ start:422 stop:556 length:135 start_codon:yes stop_codon:yes gene_type:complete